MSRIIVIGGGPAGMLAAISAARGKHEVHLLEKNEKLGKKLFITGKGRCNITNACEEEELFQSIIRNPKFFYSAFYSFTNDQVMEFFESNGLPIKIERGNRVFPNSDHSSDVIGKLRQLLQREGVDIQLNTIVTQIYQENGVIQAVKTKTGKKLFCDAVILATGGFSYQGTGSSGDGYEFAKRMGHKIMPLLPSLVPFEASEDYVKQLQGLSLRNVKVTIGKEHSAQGRRSGVIYEAFGEMMFTHFGVSGPVILSGSSILNDYNDKMPLKLTIDLKPALTKEQLDKRILREFEANSNRQYKNAVSNLFPAKLIPVMIALSRIHPDKKVNEITKEERRRLIEYTKGFPVTLTKMRDFDEAIITRGGICVKEVNPSTMESRLIKGLYFAGEILDLDALTGGFNLQIAWSTGYLAGTISNIS